MRGQELKILFKDKMAFLTKEVALDFNQVEISYGAGPVKFKAPAFWTIRVINYIEKERRLFVEPIDYQVGETEFSYVQIQLEDILMQIEKVTFKSIDTSGLLRTINGSGNTKIIHPKGDPVYRREGIQPEPKREREPIIKAYTTPFLVPIKDVNFINGAVTFNKKIQELNTVMDFHIPNENIIEEYDAIKNYFASVLKTKNIQVLPDVTIIDGVITSKNATSHEIEKIDKTFIEAVKYEIVNGARRKETTSDQQSFTVEEFIETFIDENIKSELLFKDDNDLFENLLQNSKTKHYNHLRFLSSKHRADLLKLRLVHRPFSFIFLLRSENNFHIVWETLDTQEATYIWTFPNEVKDIKKILAHIDKTISLILRIGRNEYKGQNEDNFSRVLHDYTDLQNGFKNWKREIEKIVFNDL